VVSALTGDGIPDLTDAIVEGLDAVTVSLDLLVPYERGDVVARLHTEGDVLSECHAAEGTEITVRLPAAAAGPLSRYLRDV
jgi:GTP-binding protein HflX